MKVREKKEENEVVTSHNVNWNLFRQCINEFNAIELGFGRNRTARSSECVDLLEV